jgi:hypothetical protein
LLVASILEANMMVYLLELALTFICALSATSKIRPFELAVVDFSIAHIHASRRRRRGDACFCT